MSYTREDYIPNLATKTKCTACLACVASCPKGALEPYIDADGHTYIRINKNKCVGCKKCEVVCQNSRNNFGDNRLKESQIYAAWTENDSLRKNSTSGGIFAALAKTIIEKGGAVVGSTLEGKECHHIIITNTKDIIKLQGSKYLASSLEGIYQEIEKKLSSGLVLFSGTGCQCAGVIAYFKNNKYKANLITMDIVCGGYPSKILIDKFYEEYEDVSQIVSFREKDKYILKVLRNNKVTDIKEKNLPLHGFNCELTNRYNCYNCQFAKGHRKTDITIGDLWNYNIFKDEHVKGISTVIIHSKLGETLLKESNINIKQIDWSDSIDYCKRIVYGKTPIFLPRRMLKRNAKKMKNDRFKKLYCIDIKIKDVDLFIFRIYRYIVMRANKIIAKLYTKYIINKNKIGDSNE